MISFWGKFARLIFLAGAFPIFFRPELWPQEEIEHPEVNSISWPSAQLPFPWPKTRIQASKITKQQIIALINGTEKANWVQHGEDPSDIRNDVDSFIFTTLDDGPLYLIATDDGGSTWFQYFEVIRCEEQTCFETTISSDPEIDLTKQLLDLKKDGRHQILCGILFL